jgi:P4 family phage/plasmid primase-like protien
VLIPDGDFRSNKTVRDAVEALAKALLDEGAMEVFIVRMPPPPSAKDNWKGVDDYLTAHLGLRWAGDPDKVTKAGEMIGDLINNHASRGNRTDWNYPATAPERAALRMERKYRREHHYTAAMLSETSEGSRPTGWLMYSEDRYIHVDVYRTIGNTSGKVATDNSPIIRSAMEEWEEGIRIGREEGDVEGKVAGMAADFPNRTLAILAQRLDERQNETLIEPFATVRPGDKCLRIRHGLINLTRLFEVGFDWENREKWLIPPDYRWFSNAHLDVSLSNLTNKPECPIFMAMLRHAFREDQERIDCLQLWFGKILCSPLFLSRQQFLCLYGAAGGGKGTIYRLLLRLLGDNCVAEMRANFGGRFDTAALPGKKLVVFTETPDGSAQGKFDPYMADIIKQITGEDRVICEGKGVKAVSHRIRAEVMTVGNTPPVIPMDEGAFKRRAILIRVSRAFEKRDSAMEDAMQRHELPGILVWALEGAAKLAAGAQIVTPEACLEDLGDVSMSVAPEERFIKTQLTKKSGSILSPADVMEGYQRWILENRIRVSEISKRKLGYLIREHFDIVSEVKSIKGEVKRVYVGLGFISNFY